jgi:DNA-binding response OmpR family regulator
LSSKKILLVDDSSTMLLMEQMLLGSGDYQLITARDVESALRAARAHSPDLILLDAVLPQNGLDICRRLRAEDRNRTTPIILVTTRGEAARAEGGSRGGVDDTVYKPIDNAELLAKVRNLLGD